MTSIISPLETIINNIPYKIFWKNRDSVFLGCNLAFALSAGLSSPQEIIGKTDYDLPWTKEESNAYIADDRQVMESGKPKLNIEEPQTLADGSTIILLTSKVPLFDEKGKVVGVLCIYLDITARKKMEEDLVEAKDAAEAASEAKTEFLENMRHDIRTPLTGILGFADLIKALATDPKIKEYADNLVASSHALLDFLNEILETVRLASGEIPVLKKKFSLKQQLEDIINLSQPKAKEKKLDLTLSVDPALPAYFMGDCKRIHRIALELVSNALKFTAKGSVKVSAALVKKEDNRTIVKLSVQDTGIGIPAEAHDDIFTQFKRLSPSYKGLYKGAGLGLSVVKQFVEDLDAEIYVTSEPDQGTIFSCLIPLKESLTDDTFGVDTISTPIPQTIATATTKTPPASPVSESIPTYHPPSNLSHILLVEDNNIAQMVAKTLLESLGCEVTTADDGETGLTLATQRIFDLIFMDIGLPDMDGIEVTRRIRLQERQTDAHVPIIALTAHVDSENKQKCIEAGMDAVLAKPLSQNTASDILNAFIPSRTKQTESIYRLTPEEREESYLHIPDAVKAIDFEKGLKIAMGKEDFYRELLQMLYDSIPEEITALSAAHTKQDWEAIRALVHKLNGGATSCGAVRLKLACTNLEMYLRDKSGIAQNLEETLYQNVLDEMETFRRAWQDMK